MSTFAQNREKEAHGNPDNRVLLIHKTHEIKEPHFSNVKNVKTTLASRMDGKSIKKDL